MACRARSLLIAAWALGLGCLGDNDPGGGGGRSPTRPVAVASVTVTPPSAVVTAGSLLQLRAVARDAAGSALAGPPIAWSSSDTLRARVSGTGLVNGVRPGTVTITATSGAANGTANVRVVSAAASALASPPAGPPLWGSARALVAVGRAP